jgi:hypothetical protein
LCGDLAAELIAELLRHLLPDCPIELGLVGEVPIEHCLGGTGRGCDLIHADARAVLLDGNDGRLNKLGTAREPVGIPPGRSAIGLRRGFHATQSIGYFPIPTFPQRESTHLHPQLTDGTHLAIKRTLPVRAPLQDSAGQPLFGQTPEQFVSVITLRKTRVRTGPSPDSRAAGHRVPRGHPVACPDPALRATDARTSRPGNQRNRGGIEGQSADQHRSVVSSQTLW